MSKWDNVKVGNKIKLENGYIATITGINLEQDDHRFVGTANAKSGIIHETWSNKGKAFFLVGFSFETLMEITYVRNSICTIPQGCYGIPKHTVFH